MQYRSFTTHLKMPPSLIKFFFFNRKEFNFVNKERRPWSYDDEHKGS